MPIKLLVTRPEGQQQQLCDALAAQGIDFVSLPLFDIVAATDPAAIATIKSKIQQLDRYYMAIFISTNAASLGAEWIDRYWPQFPQGLKVFAIGPATAKAISSVLDCEVSMSRSGVTSEDLLAGAEFQQLEGKKIALFRGLGGRELLREELQARGASVDYIELYQRQTISYPEDHLSDLIKNWQVNTLLVTSAKSLSVLVEMDINKSGAGLLPLLVPSERVRQQALLAGFQRVINTDGADEVSILNGLLQLMDQKTNRNEKNK